MLTSSTIDCGLGPQSGQTKDYKISICCFSAKNVVLRRKSTDWLAWNKDNVSSGNESVQVSIVCLYLYCSWISNYKGGKVGISLPGITVPPFCACPKPGPGFPTSYTMAFCVH